VGRSTSRTRRRTKRNKGVGTSKSSRWFNTKLQLLSPTPRDRADWSKVREDVWDLWAETPKEDRPEGSKLAPVAAIVLDWRGHYGPVFDERGRRIDLSIEKIEEYEELAGEGFSECKESLLKIISIGRI